jgi:hypothetical protein
VWLFQITIHGSPFYNLLCTGHCSGVLEQPPTQGVAPPVTRGQGVLPQDGVLQQSPPADEGATELPPPATEQTQPATVEEEQSVPVCQKGLEFN